jgi:uncharacterized protein
MTRSPLSEIRRGLWTSLLVLATLLTPSAHAKDGSACLPQPTPLSAAQVQQGMREAVDRGFLWKLSQGGHRSYLYGTLHVARLPWMFPGPQVTRAINESGTVALELDLLDPDIVRRLGAAVIAPPGKSSLPAPLARRLAAQAAAACAEPGFARLYPEMQAVTLTALAARRSGLEPGYSIDGFLAGLSHQQNKSVKSLETPESQIALLVQTQRADTERLVAGILDELDSGRALRSLVRLAEAWGGARFDDLDNYPAWCECLNTDDDRAFMKRVLDDRNLVLADSIAALHRGGERVFAAVGALHMFGPQGLPALLAARGFEVERVAFAAPMPAVAPASVASAPALSR